MTDNKHEVEKWITELRVMRMCTHTNRKGSKHTNVHGLDVFQSVKTKTVCALLCCGLKKKCFDQEVLFYICAIIVIHFGQKIKIHDLEWPSPSPCCLHHLLIASRFVCQTFGERFFSFNCLTVRNSLPSDIRSSRCSSRNRLADKCGSYKRTL